MDKLLAMTHPANIEAFLKSDKGVTLLRWITFSGIAFVSIWLVLMFLRPFYAIGISETESLPWTFYLIKKGEKPVRGDLMVFRIPDTARYYPRGYLFTKYAVGIGGDVVDFKGREVFVNGQSRGMAKQYSKKGHTLELGPSGVIPPGHFFAWTPHKDSYDTRYADIGWVGPDQVEGTAIALF